MTVPLEALLRRASRDAENLFNKLGEIEMFFLCEDTDGEQFVIFTPVIAGSALAAHEYKNKLAEKMREEFAQRGVVRYVMCSECWVGPPISDYKDMAEQYAAAGFTWENHPQQQEAIMLRAEDSAVCLQATRDIIRPPGGKPYLGKLSEITRPAQAFGRFMDLLPRDRRIAAG